jgi:hypothetical protein
MLLSGKKRVYFPNAMVSPNTDLLYIYVVGSREADAMTRNSVRAYSTDRPHGVIEVHQQSRAVPSLLVVRMYFPLGEKVMLGILFVWPVKRRTSCPVCTSYKRAVTFCPLDTTYLPSGENATPIWAFKLWISWTHIHMQILLAIRASDATGLVPRGHQDLAGRCECHNFRCYRTPNSQEGIYHLG